MKTVSLKALHTEEGRRDPYRIYAKLHEMGQVCAVEPGEHYSFVVHGFDACTQVLRDSATFRVTDESTLATVRGWDENRAHAVFMNSMFFTNAPRHTRMRKMFSQAFTPRRIQALEPAIDRLTLSLLDGLADRTADFMREFAFPLPAHVLGELLGVPQEDREWYRPRALTIGELLELGGARPSVIRRADAAAVEITDYFAKLVAQRRIEPRDDLISAVLAVLADEPEMMSDHELLANLVVVFNAGFVTTTHLLGNGLTILLSHEELLQRLRDDPALAPSYVEEILRYEVPTHFSVRHTATDAVVDGVEIPKGSWVLVLAAAANRDPKRFVDPDVFDPGRTENHTLAFSAGAHYCLGAALARLEGVRGLNLLLDRFPVIELAKPPGTPRQLMLRGHEELWLTMRSRR